MTGKEKYRYGINETKTEILTYILKNDGYLSEVAIWKHLSEEFGKIDRSIVNRHLHDLMDLKCVILVPPEKKGLGNAWSIQTIGNLRGIKENFADISLNKFEKAIKIVMWELGFNIVRSRSYKYRAKQLSMSPSFFNECLKTDIDELYLRAWNIFIYNDDPEKEHTISQENRFESVKYNILFEYFFYVDIMTKAVSGVELQEEAAFAKTLKKIWNGSLED
jgi:hypothetical protein